MFTFTAATPYQQYSITSGPLTPGVTGQRYFFTDQSGVIRVNTSSAASSTDNPLS
jgi:uncharacterized protein YdeI (BOF family)